MYKQKIDVINEKFKFNYCISYSTRKILTYSSGGYTRKPVKERLRARWFFSLEKAKRAGGSTAVCKYFTRGYKEDRDRLRCAHGQKRGNLQKSDQEKFWPGIRKNHLPWGWWNIGRGSPEGCDSLISRWQGLYVLFWRVITFKNHLDINIYSCNIKKYI